MPRGELTKSLARLLLDGSQRPRLWSWSDHLGGDLWQQVPGQWPESVRWDGPLEDVSFIWIIPDEDAAEERDGRDDDVVEREKK